MRALLTRSGSKPHRRCSAALDVRAPLPEAPRERCARECSREGRAPRSHGDATSLAGSGRPGVALAFGLGLRLGGARAVEARHRSARRLLDDLLGPGEVARVGGRARAGSKQAGRRSPSAEGRQAPRNRRRRIRSRAIGVRLGERGAHPRLGARGQTRAGSKIAFASRFAVESASSRKSCRLGLLPRLVQGSAPHSPAREQVEQAPRHLGLEREGGCSRAATGGKVTGSRSRRP